MQINKPMIDYVTLTTWVYRNVEQWAKFEPDGTDCKRKAVNLAGYKGVMVSCSTGSIFIGEGEQIHPVTKVKTPHYICKVSGEMAQTFFVYHETCPYFKPDGVEQKRIDVQVTIEMPEGYSAGAVYQEVKTELVRIGRSDTIRLVESGLGKTAGMDTIYFGSRERARRMVRMYAKEDIDGRRYLRFEVEQKEGQALTFRSPLIESDILDALRRRIPIRIRSKKGSVFGKIADCLIPGKHEPRRVVTKTRDTIRWLYDSVTPAILKGYSDHQMGGYIRQWLDDLISSLPPDNDDYLL